MMAMSDIARGDHDLYVGREGPEPTEHLCPDLGCFGQERPFANHALRS